MPQNVEEGFWRVDGSPPLPIVGQDSSYRSGGRLEEGVISSLRRRLACRAPVEAGREFCGCREPERSCDPVEVGKGGWRSVYALWPREEETVRSSNV